MNFKDLIIVGVALAMDAVGVSISIGVNSAIKRINKIPKVVGGIAIAVVGILMIKDGFDNEEKDESLLLKKGIVLILGISVSIDAFVVGFTGFSYISNIIRVIGDCSIIGFITLVLCTFAFYLCRYIRKIEFVSKYADFFGGITLIINYPSCIHLNQIFLNHILKKLEKVNL